MHTAMVRRWYLQGTFPLWYHTSINLPHLDQKLSVLNNTEMLMSVKTSIDKPLNVITKNKYTQDSGGNVYMAEFRHTQRFLVML